MPITRATTSNLDALKLLSQADALRWSGRERESIGVLQRAVEVDPDCALAWARLATALRNQGGDLARRLAAGTRAFELRDRVSEPERYYIEGHYYEWVVGNATEAIRTYELWKTTYPRANIPHGNLSVSYSLLGEYEKAAEEARESMRLEPNNYFAYGQLVSAYVNLNRLDEARAVIEKAHARKLDGPSLHVDLYEIACLRGDTAAMDREAEWGRGRADADVVAAQSKAAFCRGRLREARALGAKAREIDRANGLIASANFSQALMSISEGLVGNPKEARALADGVARSAAGDDPDRRTPVSRYLVVAYANLGDGNRVAAFLGRGQALAGTPARLDSQRAAEVAFIQGLLALKGGNGEKAVELFRPIAPYERAWPYMLAPQYWRGYAYLAARKPAEAASEFEKVIAAPYISPLSPTIPLAQLGLARTRAAAGDIAASRTEYEKFFGLWKDADPDVPILLEAKREYAALNRR